MDILSLVKLLAPLAPVAASIAGGMVAGPAGAAAAGKLTSIIMGKFGVEPTSPNAVGQLSDRMAEAGEETARAKINAAMEQARAEIAGFVEVEKSANELLAKSLTETGLTMRAELGHEHWFFTGWRPFIGWVFGVTALCFGLMLTAATGLAAWRSPDPLKTLTDAWPLFAVFFGTLGAVVGVLIPSRSLEKKTALENSAPMPNAKPPAVVVPPMKPLITKPGAGGIVQKPPGSRD